MNKYIMYIYTYKYIFIIYNTISNICVHIAGIHTYTGVIYYICA